MPPYFKNYFGKYGFQIGATLICEGKVKFELNNEIILNAKNILSEIIFPVLNVFYVSEIMTE